MVDVEAVQAEFASGRQDMERFILVMLFMVEQRWRYFIDKDLEPDGITMKQWLMAIIISAGFRSPPSIREVADAMSTTHQNVKQIAAGMERRGLMILERDPDNRRIVRLKVTDRCHDIFRQRNAKDTETIAGMFENLTDDEMKALFRIIAKVESRADRLYREAKASRPGAAEESER